MATMPANVSYGAVTGRFMRAVADGPDLDRTPEGLPLVGLKVTFTPSVRMFKSLTDMVTIFVDPISGTTNEDGLLVDSQGGEAIYLLATDDPDLLPSGWTWSVSISSPSIPTLAFNFALPSNGSIDLTSVIPVSANPGSVPPPVSSVAGLHGDVMAPDLALALEPFMTGGGGGGAVSSVNGKVGAVTITATDVGALPGATVIPTTPADIGAATAAQGAKADAAVPATRKVAGKALSGDVTLTAADVGAATAAQGAKADTAVQPSGLTKSAVGLGNVDNTSDANKPISTATQTALDAKKAASWTPSIADLPPGSTFTVFGNVARPTSRTDITVRWIHDTLPAAFNVASDEWLNI